MSACHYTPSMNNGPPDDRVTWIGHRGSPVHFPENTLEGYEAVLRAGGRCIETDIQLSADGVPFLYHDVELDRISGTDGSLFDLDADKVHQLPASFPGRFGETYSTLRISSLSDLVTLVKSYPDTTLFVELKEESAEHYGVAALVEAVLPAIEPIREQCVAISFDPDVVQHVEAVSDLSAGWVVPEWNDENREIAEVMDPQWLFCNRKRLPEKNRDLWHGGWQRALYTINDTGACQELVNRGFTRLETDRILDILNGQF